MSISSVSANQSFQMQVASANKSSSLSTDQKNFINDVLSQYDADSLSSDDAKAIVAAFQEAAIEPSSGLQSAMSASGFDAKEIGDLAGVGKSGGGRPAGGPPPPPPSEEELSSIADLLESLLDSEDETTTNSSTASITGYDETTFTSYNRISFYA